MSGSILSQEVYEWLLRRLLNGDLRPGTHLNRRKVAEQFGVSVAPALEAMLRLELEGFLKTFPRQGTRVQAISEEDVQGKMIVRQALEVQAARMYCGEPIRANRTKLLKLAKLVDKTSPKSMVNWKEEVAFHRALVGLTDCQMLIDSFDLIMKHSLFYAHNRVLPVLPKKKIAPDSHQKLLDALETQTPDEAECTIREHIQARISLGVTKDA